MPLTHAAVQARLSEASAVLASLPTPADEVDAAELALARAAFVVFSAYTASGNSIPGLRGLGLTEILEAAELIIEHGSMPRRLSEKALAQAFAAPAFEQGRLLSRS